LAIEDDNEPEHALIEDSSDAKMVVDEGEIPQDKGIHVEGDAENEEEEVVVSMEEETVV